MQTSKKILIVEDEWKIARFLQMELEHEGYDTKIEHNGLTAYHRIVQEEFDLVLLDVMLPGMDGMTICRKVRELSKVPIIMLTAKDEVADRVNGLDLGADDYLCKPFAMQELLARARAVFRKQQDVPKNLHSDLTIRGLQLKPDSHEVTVNSCPVDLSKKEFELLEYLLRNRNIVLGRERIIEEVWGYDYMGDSNVVDVYIRYLRSKIDDHFGEKYIHTVRGIGYVVKD